MKVKKLHWVLLLFLTIIYIWSVIKPRSYLTWALETTPVIIGLIYLIITYKRARFTDITYLNIAFAAMVVFVGGHYTYGGNPLFEKLSEYFNWHRNYYDRFGHFVLGVTVGLIAREVLLRKSPQRQGKMLIFLIFSITLAFGAAYEIIEWLAAMIGKQNASAFLGTQGDVWDAQWDMFLAILGAIVPITIYKKTHDRQLAEFIHKNKKVT